MKISILSRLFTCIAMLVVGVLSPSSTVGDDAKLIQAVNTTGQDISCLVLYIRGTSGDLTLDPSMVFGGPYRPDVRVTHQLGYSTVKLDWRECVIPPRATISALLQTSNGSLGFRGGVWCKRLTRVARLNIPQGTSGEGNGGSFQPLPPRSSAGGSYKLGLESRRKGTIPPFKTPWFKGPPRYEHRSFCWWRYCCTPGYDWEYRLAFYCSPFSTSSIFGATRICIPLSPWRYGGTRPGKYKWQFTSVRPRGDVIEWNIFGPPKDLSRKLAGIGTEFSRNVFVADADSGTYSQSLDASSAFRKMSADLNATYELDFEIPRPNSFEDILQMHGTPYLNAAETATQLVRVLREALSTDPDPAFILTTQSLQSIARGMHTIGTCFSSGRAPSAEVLYGMARDYATLAQQANLLSEGPGFHRLTNVASAYRALAEQYALAADQIHNGLDSVAERDDFLWAMLIGSRNSLRDAGVAFEPHARVVFGLPNYEWDSNTIPAAVIKLETISGRVVDRYDVPVSDFNTIQFPFLYNIDPDERYVATVKIPGCLARSFGVSMENDGNSIRIQELVTGDVDDDNCVTTKDLRLAIGDEGEGGQDADAVPPTDANSDGIVDEIDAEVVHQNLGACGDGD